MREQSMSVGTGAAGVAAQEPTYEMSIRTRSLGLRRDGSGSASEGVYVPTFTPWPEDLSNGEVQATHTEELLLSKETHRTMERESLERMDSMKRLEAKLARLRSLPVQHFPESPPGPLTVAYTSANSFLKISDTAAVTALYNELFLEMQQAVCKILCKAFIFVVMGNDGESFDIGRHLYMPGMEAPDWWPEEGVRHMYTDHILKVERLRLLCHLLRLRHVTIDRLEAQSRQMLAKTPHVNGGSWLREEVDEERGRRIKLSLDRLFSIAKVEEKFLMGLIDPDTIIMEGKGLKADFL